MMNRKSTYKTAAAAFVSGTLMFIAVILPDLIGNKGVLLFCGDYVQQSVPFTYTIYDHLKSFTFGWDFGTGLGSDFLTSYAFYGLFSPFSLLYLPFPRSMLIYAMPYVTALKYGTGTLFGFFYIKKHVKEPHFAVVGGLVYMFSSFSAYNEVFHFTDTVALFPLFLIALDELCENGRKGVFALSVALMALTNYYFFFGQAVFAVIYFFCMYFDADIGAFLKKLAITALEAVIGVMMSCFVLMPVAYALLQSPKAVGFMGASDMLFYDSVYKYLHILQSVFSVPDGFALTTLFPETDTAYPYGMLMGSDAAYIPLFSAAGVISYCFVRGNTRARVFFAVCAVFALIPVLNQSFSAFNSAFYARWYYMPMLIGACVSVKALENKVSLVPGISVCAAVLVGLAVYRAFLDENELVRMTADKSVINAPLGIINIAVAAASLVLLVLTAKSVGDRDFIPKLYIFSFVGIYACFGIMTFYNLTGFDLSDPTDKSVLIGMYALDGRMTAELRGGERIAVPAQAVNYPLIWGYPTTAHFNSLTDTGLTGFLEMSGMRNTNGTFSDISASTRELADLVSVRYIFSRDSGADNPDTAKVCDYGMYGVYENKRCVPFGCTYGMMLSKSFFDGIGDSAEKRAAYMKYLIVEDLADFEGLLTLCDGTYAPVSSEEYAECAAERQNVHAYDTKFSSGGVSAKITLGQDSALLCQISLNDGFTAYVDGAETRLYKADNGLAVIKVPAGEHAIELKYHTPMLGAGIAVSAAGAACWIAYTAVSLHMTDIRGKRAERERCRRHIFAKKTQGRQESR